MPFSDLSNKYAQRWQGRYVTEYGSEWVNYLGGHSQLSIPGKYIKTRASGYFALNYRVFELPTSCWLLKDEIWNNKFYQKKDKEGKEKRNSMERGIDIVLHASLWEISTCRNFTISVPDSEVVSSISLSQIKWSLSNISSNKSLRSPASSHFLRKATYAIASKNKKRISVCRRLS